MKYTLPYGKGQLEFSLPDEVQPLTIVPGGRPALPDPLAEMLRQKRPEKIVVVLNEITRPTPYPVLLPPLLKAFSEAGIEDRQVTFLIALGVHSTSPAKLCRPQRCRRWRRVAHSTTRARTCPGAKPRRSARRSAPVGS